MSKITINKTSSYNKNIPNIRSISFDYMGGKVYSAEKIQRMYGVFVSQPIEGESSIVNWKEVIFTAQKYDGTDIYIYIKSSNTLTRLENAIWNGPYLNYTNDITGLTGRFLQFMIVLVNYGVTNINYENLDVAITPILSSISLTYFSSSSSSKFFTVAFDLGFIPKHILLTYNGDVSSDAIVRFAVSGFDSIDINDYQYIDPNKIEDLSDLSVLSTKIKLMIEMLGHSTIPTVIHEVALMITENSATTFIIIY